MVEKSLFLVSFVHKKYSHSFVKLRLNDHWCHMDCFIDVLTTFLGLGTFQFRCRPCKVRKLSDFIKNILICVPEMNEEQHEGT